MSNGRSLIEMNLILGALFIICVTIVVGLLADPRTADNAAVAWNNSTPPAVMVAAAVSSVTAEQRAYCLHLQEKNNSLQTVCAPGCTYQVAVNGGAPVIDVMSGPAQVPKKIETATQSTYEIKWSRNCPGGKADCPLPPGKVFYVVGMPGLSPGGSSDPSRYGPILCDKSSGAIPPTIGSAINQSQYGSTIGAQLSGYSGSSQSPTASLGTVKTAPQSLAQTISNSQAGYSWNNLPSQPGIYPTSGGLMSYGPNGQYYWNTDTFANPQSQIPLGAGPSVVDYNVENPDSMPTSPYAPDTNPNNFESGNFGQLNDPEALVVTRTNPCDPSGNPCPVYPAFARSGIPPTSPTPAAPSVAANENVPLSENVIRPSAGIGGQGSAGGGQLLPAANDNAIRTGQAAANDNRAVNSQSGGNNGGWATKGLGGGRGGGGGMKNIYCMAGNRPDPFACPLGIKIM